MPAWQMSMPGSGRCRLQWKGPLSSPCRLLNAGRMQDNEPLMRALSNLITVNDPDLVLFVGEALVRHYGEAARHSVVSSMVRAHFRGLKPGQSRSPEAGVSRDGAT